jgi:hypothetical protein
MYLPLSIRANFTNDRQKLADFDIISYTMLEAYAKTLNMNLSPKQEYSYNAQTKELYLFVTPQTDAIAGLTVSVLLDEEDAYENMWLQQYATALSRIMYGRNLMKWIEDLPGSSRINFEGIISEGKEDRDRLEEQLFDQEADFPQFFIG